MNPSLTGILAVAAGGALGATARYLSVLAIGRWLGAGFPWGTFAVNVAGSFVMGVLAELAMQAWQPPPELKLFLTVGVLGGFTTFSSFSLDTALLIERGDFWAAAAYVTGSVLISIAALFAGLALTRMSVA
ncbi:fluoride efflux transporter CrcB [Indioceanicola profundi]|uniref:fluoride efflux transporter CrcB n=1 Tax=Indioceanicola profundi TaxID=2220096 RepID=UPI000E6ACA97|nr:fluoride efflux transporter CrcB [Indioceanicola profundi]